MAALFCLSFCARHSSQVWSQRRPISPSLGSRHRARAARSEPPPTIHRVLERTSLRFGRDGALQPRRHHTRHFRRRLGRPMTSFVARFAFRTFLGGFRNGVFARGSFHASKMQRTLISQPWGEKPKRHFVAALCERRLFDRKTTGGHRPPLQFRTGPLPRYSSEKAMASRRTTLFLTARSSTRIM